MWLDRSVAAPGPYLALVTSQNEFDKALKHLKLKYSARYVNDGAIATTTHLDNENGDIVCIVGIDKARTENFTSIEVACVLVHEAVHVWQAYQDRIGEDEPGKEQEAYAIQAISIQLMEAYAKTL